MNNNCDIYKDDVFTVNDPWIGQDIAFFYNKEHAKLFVKAYRKWKKKNALHRT